MNPVLKEQFLAVRSSARSTLVAGVIAVANLAGGAVAISRDDGGLLMLLVVVAAVALLVAAGGVFSILGVVRDALSEAYEM
jgi:hypothetical protein